MKALFEHLKQIYFQHMVTIGALWTISKWCLSERIELKNTNIVKLILWLSKKTKIGVAYLKGILIFLLLKLILFRLSPKDQLKVLLLLALAYFIKVHLDKSKETKKVSK